MDFLPGYPAATAAYRFDRLGMQFDRDRVQLAWTIYNRRGRFLDVKGREISAIKYLKNRPAFGEKE